MPRRSHAVAQVPDEAEEPGTHSLRRALEIIGLVSDRPGIGLTALAGALGVHKSTASRICATLVQAGLLEQEFEAGARHSARFRLGLWLFVLGSRTVAALELKRQAPPIMRRLAEQTQLPTYLSVVWHQFSICVEETPGRAGSVWLGSSVGVPQPVYATATGKLYLADLPEAEARAYLDVAGFRPLAPNTLTGAEAVLAELERVRQLGYALNDEETEYGVRYLGVAVRSADGRVLGGLTLGATTEQRTREQLTAALPELRAAAAALETRLTPAGPSPLTSWRPPIRTRPAGPAGPGSARPHRNLAAQPAAE